MAEAWMPREQWEALVRGEGCELCEVLKERPDVNEYGVTVVEMGISLFRLMFNQYAPGYAVLVCTRHVREPYELAQAEYTQFFDDMMRAGRALENVFQPVKMNFQILGNLTPHLHAHIIPRYYGDDAPGRPLDPWKERRNLSLDEMKKRVEALRAVL
jgi:diadenosine tetraphosphate (Ap4A) HIT family hydrolase